VARWAEETRVEVKLEEADTVQMATGGAMMAVAAPGEVVMAAARRAEEVRELVTKEGAPPGGVEEVAAMGREGMAKVGVMEEVPQEGVKEVEEMEAGLEVPKAVAVYTGVAEDIAVHQRVLLEVYPEEDTEMEEVAEAGERVVVMVVEEKEAVKAVGARVEAL